MSRLPFRGGTGDATPDGTGIVKAKAVEGLVPVQEISVGLGFDAGAQSENEDTSLGRS